VKLMKARSILLLLALYGTAEAKIKLQERTIAVDLHGTRHLRIGESLSRVAVGSNEIADVAAFPPDQILVTGKKLGQTQATLWTSDETLTITIVVGYPSEVVVSALKQAIPDGRNLRVTNAGTALVISGEVSDTSDAEHAGEIVHGFLPPPTPGTTVGPQVVNMLRVTGDQQVQLEVSFAEVSRSALKQMGFNFWHRGTGPDRAGGIIGPSQSQDTLQAPAGDLSGVGTPLLSTPLNGAFGLLFSLGTSSDFPFAAALSVLSSNGYARTLAEPTMVAMSGQEADFLAGGEFPLPIPQALGQVIVEFKKFGIQLKFVPTVMRDTIQLKLTTIVSDLDFSLGIKLASVTVPGLKERQSATTVRLKDGQSFAIAGLLSDQVRSSVDKIPWLGDIPVLGSLFRSTNYRREETELMVVVTAHLVRPQNKRPPLPGEMTQADPRDLELFLLGNIESKKGGYLPHVPPPAEADRPVGPVGFKRHSDQ
jgi:pilus assembly protein CpaC